MNIMSTRTVRVRFRALGLAVLATGTLAAPAPAQQARSNPVPVSRAAGTELSARLMVAPAPGQSWTPVAPGQNTLPVGQYVAVCVTAARDGYLSVWSRTLDGAAPVRVFPNDFTPEERRQKAGRVSAGQEVCFGEGANGYRLAVTEPYGPAEVYLHWSSDLDGQFGPEDMPQIPDPGKRALSPVTIESVQGGPDAAPGQTPTGARYSSATIGYVVSR